MLVGSVAVMLCVYVQVLFCFVFYVQRIIALFFVSLISISLSGCPIAAAEKMAKVHEKTFSSDGSSKINQTSDRVLRYCPYEPDMNITF